MKGLLRNNYFAVRLNARVFAILMLLWGIFAAVVVSQPLLIGYSMSGMIGFSLNAMLGLREDRTSKWSRYKLTVPVKRADIVKSYFISHLVWLIAGIVFAGAVMIASSMLHGFLFDRSRDIFTVFVLGIGINLFMGAIFFPLCYLGGEERHEVFTVISLLCGIVIIMGLTTLINTLFPDMTALQFILGELIILACALFAYALSYPLTVAIFRKKEY